MKVTYIQRVSYFYQLCRHFLFSAPIDNDPNDVVGARISTPHLKCSSYYSSSYLCNAKQNITYLLHGAEVLLEKLTGFAANQEIPRILWNPKVHYSTHKRTPPVPTMSQLHTVPTTPSHFLKIHLNIILPSTSWSPQWSLSLRFPHQNLVHTSPFLHTCHMPRPSHSSRFYHPQNIGWGVTGIQKQIYWTLCQTVVLYIDYC